MTTLNRRDAKLRATAATELQGAISALDGYLRSSAFRWTIYDKPRSALRSIARADARLAKAKHALRAWARA